MPAGNKRGAKVRLILTFALAGLVVALSACANLPGSDGTRGWHVGGDGDDDSITLDIRNDNANDARIYLRWNGDRRRLGYVSSKSQESFQTDWRPNSLRIEVDFLAGRGFVSDPTSVSPGQRLDFRIPVNY